MHIDNTPSSTFTGWPRLKQVRAAILGVVILASGCTDRSLVANAGDGACTEIDCPCDAHSDCAPGTTCVDARCTPTCGNGVVDPGEQCDAIDPGCNSLCLIPGGTVTLLDAPEALGRDIAISHDGTLAIVGSGNGDATGWIAAMEPSGDVLWESTIEGPDGVWAIPWAVAVADDGDVVATGGAQSRGAWVRRYSSDGDLRWTTQFGSAIGDPAVGVALAPVGEDVLAVCLVWTPRATVFATAMRFDSSGDELGRVDVDPVGGSFDDWSIAAGDAEAWIAGRLGQSVAFVGRIADATTVLEPLLLGATLPGSATGIGITLDGGTVVGGDDSNGGWLNAWSRDGASTWQWRSDTVVGINDLAVDGAGDVVIVGTEAYRAFVKKFRPDGTPSWTFVPPDGADGSFVEPYHALAIDDDGFVYALTLTDSPTDAITKLAP